MDLGLVFGCRRGRAPRGRLKATAGGWLLRITGDRRPSRPDGCVVWWLSASTGTTAFASPMAAPGGTVLALLMASACWRRPFGYAWQYLSFIRHNAPPPIPLYVRPMIRGSRFNRTGENDCSRVDGSVRAEAAWSGRRASR